MSWQDDNNKNDNNKDNNDIPTNSFATCQRLNLLKSTWTTTTVLWRTQSQILVLFLGFQLHNMNPTSWNMTGKFTSKMRGVAIEELMVGWFKRFSLLTNHLNNGCGRQSLLALTDRTLNSRFSNCSNLSSSTLTPTTPTPTPTTEQSTAAFQTPTPTYPPPPQPSQAHNLCFSQQTISVTTITLTTVPLGLC